MADARVEKLARVLVNYSMELKPGQTFWLRTTPLAEELNLEVYKEAIKAGVHVFVDQRMPGTDEIFYKYASTEQLDYVSPIRKMVIETFDASLYIEALHNSRSLSGIDGHASLGHGKQVRSSSVNTCSVLPKVPIAGV